MKLKELKKTVNVSWSPCDYYPAMLATGSAAQQVDSSFSSTSTLELYALNLEDSGLDLELKSSLETQHKFQKIVWSGAGVIVGGCDGGLLEFYSTDKLLKNASDSRLGSSTKHTGHVSALDINPYQKNLLASGASESEIFIWDLNNTAQPMAPGNRSQPHEHVQALAWNQQVQHILGSTFATRCVVWDLRKNEPIMKLSDSQSRTRWRSLAWHPSVATQLCIASEDDQVPVIQLWDLRLAASPLLTMEGHRQGVLGLAWSAADSSLLLSAGKDGRVLCWDPNNTRPGGEVVQEVVTQPQWVFDVAWSGRVPGLLTAASFDQQLGVHSLLAADKPELTSQSQSTIMDSFGGLESFSQLPAVTREPQQDTRAHAMPQPARPPKWLKRTVAAKFGFGGKLVMFEKCPQENGTQKLAYISQVVSEPEMIERAAQLDAVLSSSLSQDPAATEQLAEYCRQRGDAATAQQERYTWFFLRANFLPNFRAELLNLLGFKQDEIPSKFKSAVTDGAHPDLAALSIGESTETEAELSTDTSTDLSDAHTLIERKLANVDLGPTVKNVVIPNGEDQTSVICRALVCGNLEEAVELCLEAKRIADALIIASLGSQELLYKVQKYHLKQSASDPVSLVAGSLLQSRWDVLVTSSSPHSWKDVLAALLTHCDGEALSHYCEMLGEKLSSESEPSLCEAATICFLCAMSPEQLVSRWTGGRGLARGDAAALAALTETVLLARAAAAVRGRHLQTIAKLEAVLHEYAWRLAGQGRLQSALGSLEGTSHTDLRDRLTAALGLTQRQTQQPGQYNRNRTLSSHSQKRSHLTGHEASNTYNTIPGPYEHKPWQQAPVPAANSFPHSGFPQAQPLQSQPLPSQPPQPLQPQLPQPPTQQPPRPGSVGPQSAGGLPSRSKYKVDPSVQSAPRYNQYSFNNAQPYAGYNSPLPDHYSSSSVPNPSYTPVNNTMNPLNPVNPLNPIAPMNPVQPNQLNPIAPLNPVQPNQLNPTNPLNPVNPSNPSMNGGYYNPSIVPPEPAAPQKPAAPGWNDPPMMSSKAKPKQEVPAQAPITHPLFGVEPPQHVPLTGPQYGQYPGQVPAQQYLGQTPGQQYPGQAPAQQYPGQTFPGQAPAQYQGQSQYPGQYQQQQQQQFPDQMNQAYQQGRESPVPPAPKAPIPAQYQPMVNVFDALTNECSNRAANPQMKRKLEDVHKRLETLYDMLRENRLSDGALATLQSCASLASSGDLEGASQTATSLAAGAEFASVASFLPGLKVLMQVAGHLQVRLQ